MNNPDLQLSTEVENSSYSPALSMPRFALAMILSLGTYQFYWCWRQWREFRGDLFSPDISPGLRVLGLFVPFLNLVLVYKLSALIQERCQPYCAKMLTPLLIMLLYMLQLGLNRAINKMDVPFLEFSVLLLPLVAFGSLQYQLNAYWQQVLPERPPRPFSLGEKCLIGFFGLFFMLSALGDFLTLLGVPLD